MKAIKGKTAIPRTIPYAISILPAGTAFGAVVAIDILPINAVAVDVESKESVDIRLPSVNVSADANKKCHYILERLPLVIF